MNALIVVDIQKTYIDKYEKELISSINERISLAIQYNEIIIYIKNVRMLKSGESTYDFADGLIIYSENIILKKKSSIFSNDKLLKILNDNRISQITIIGIDGNCCVASSAIDAKNLGYNVLMPSKYIGVQNCERFKKKKIYLKKLGILIS